MALLPFRLKRVVLSMGADADFIGGHGILAMERFMDETRHMIIFDTEFHPTQIPKDESGA